MAKMPRDVLHWSLGMEQNRVTFRAGNGPTAVLRGNLPLPRYHIPLQFVQTPGAGTGSGFLFSLALIVCFVLVGRAFDYGLTGYHIPAIICVVALLSCMLKGGFGLLRSRIGIPLLGLIGWMFLATPFSTWRGDSASVVVYFAFYSLMWLPMAMGPRSMKDIRRLILLLALLNIVTLLLTKYDEGGRLIGMGASFSNSEDIALIAAMSIPFWMLAASQIKFPPARFLLSAASLLFLLRVAALTGSRAILMAVGAMGLVFFVRTDAVKRFMLIAGVIAAIGVVIVTVPTRTLARLGTVVDAFQDRTSALVIGGSTEAMDSAAERRQLLLDSIAISVSHPLFGVGPGQFAMYRWTQWKDQGVRMGYLVTHNAFTEVSSEEGIPGLIFFIGVIVGTLRTIRNARKLNSPGSHKDWRTGQDIATCLELSFIVIVVCGLFLANAQYIFWYLMGGIALALERVTIHLIRQERLAAPLAEKAHSPQSGRPMPRPRIVAR